MAAKLNKKSFLWLKKKCHFQIEITLLSAFTKAGNTSEHNFSKGDSSDNSRFPFCFASLDDFNSTGMASVEAQKN